MTDDLEERAQRIQSEATDGAGEGEPALSVEGILDVLDAEFGELADIVATTGDLPEDASIRANGYFDDPAALEEWLVLGGLLAYDVDGNPVKLGIVYVIKEYDEIDHSWYYQVYIRDSSEEPG